VVAVIVLIAQAIQRRFDNRDEDQYDPYHGWRRSANKITWQFKIKCPYISSNTTWPVTCNNWTSLSVFSYCLSCIYNQHQFSLKFTLHLTQ
jgi:hypothetical protein